MRVPQIIFIVLAGIDILTACCWHGRKIKYQDFGSVTLSFLIYSALFIFGGFFRGGMGVWQILIIALYGWDYLIHAIFYCGKIKYFFTNRFVPKQHNALLVALMNVATAVFLYFGGFFDFLLGRGVS